MANGTATGPHGGSAGGESKRGFSLDNSDILQNILGRLSARSFSSAACVSKTWNSVCNRILSRPKLASAVSLNPSLHLAVDEVLRKVFSEPIRPHFAIAFIGVEFNLETTHHLITKALGSKTPVITNAARGIIGIDALTNEVKEVKWELAADDDDDDDSNIEEYNLITNRNRGIVLVVGYLPGFKVNAISLLRPDKVAQGPGPGPGPMIDKFIMDIRDYTVSVSGSASPACIIMFGDQHVDMKPIIAKLDSAMAEETVIVGDASGCFLSNNDGNYHENGYVLDAVALVLARDRNKPQGVGETIFQFTSSVGIIPFGPQLKAVSTSVRGSKFTWLSALMEGHDEILYGQSILEDLKEEIDDDLETELYIGVRQKREHRIGSEKLGLGTFLALYKVLGGDREYFVVDGIGIKPGDSFLFYHSDSETASSSSYIALEDLATLKPDSSFQNHPKTRTADTPVSAAGNDDSDQMNQVFGGLIFSCHSRGESYFGRPNVNVSPFFENFPGVPVAGMFCDGEIGRAFSSSIREAGEEESDSIRSCLHFNSTVYLVMSYIPSPME